MGLGAALLWGGVALAEGPYDERAHYEQARFCPGRAAQVPSQSDCLRRGGGRVVEKYTDMGSRYVKLRWASGAERRYQTEGGNGADCYEDARRGSYAEMVTWRGKLMRFTVRGKTCHVSPHSDGALVLAALPGWAGSGLALACVLLPGRLLAHRPLLRFGAWMGLWGFGYFPAIQVVLGEAEFSWVWLVCVPGALLCAVLALVPPGRGETRIGTG
ncbi:hypothetical protein [Streptomyces triticagri]|uniref:hypothetical protein n=1 Tax=Streptomyces triticagri TaxID=2293568 RepID=UPI000FFBF1AE|nr:hypothetical protein [Streptomyces triticagri]